MAIAKPGGEERRPRIGCGSPTRSDVSRTVRSEASVRRALSGTAEHSPGRA
ncbi:hypothetical protein [Nocardiopsis salina]|uniref:hypothetical protein n=1 Tax=Nocardiopsis salina TaxID=245836 RepID=UPI00034C26D1|nr:hypothetical protein [Nocardiopsis salina]